MKNYLGVDWGLAKIGISLANSEVNFAFVYSTIKNDKKLITEISEIIKKENIGKIVIGVPMHLLKDNKIFGGKELGQELEKIEGVKVYYQNEMFTTQSAERNLKEKGLKKIKRFDDAESARIILQDWLDIQRG